MIDLKMIDPFLSSTYKIPPTGKYTGVSTDSRSYRAGEIFVALSGPHFNGLKFIPDVLSQDCQFIVCISSIESRESLPDWKEDYPTAFFLLVEDTLDFFQQFSRAHALSWQSRSKKKKLIGITGSNGKTTTKEMLYSILSAAFPGKVLKTEENFNNHIGVPKTLLRLNSSIDIGIIEMGTNHPGEIAKLCEIAPIDCGLITNIGNAHLEFFKNRENIFKEKKSLYDGIMKNSQMQGAFIINGDDPLLKTLADDGPECIRLMEKVGSLPQEKKLVGYSLLDSRLDLFFSDKTLKLENNNLIGRHNFMNLGMAFLLALQLFPSMEKSLVMGAEGFVASGNRSSLIDWKGKKVFLDAYNANPSSMKVSIQEFFNFLKRDQVEQKEQLYIIGDMNELGSEAARFHREVGAFLAEIGVNNVVFIGRYSHFLQQGLGKDCLVCESREEFVGKHWQDLLKRFNYIFIKASRSLKLESLLE